MTIVNGISPRIKNAHIYRQALATLASCLLSMTGGLTFGYTAVLLPELEKDETYPYDKDYDSWIASVSPLAMIFGCLVTGPMSDAIGRKKGLMLLTFPLILGWIIIGLAGNNAIMLTGRSIIGACTGAMRPLGMIYISELADPLYRAIVLFCPGLAFHIGTFFSHCVSHYVHRKIVCFLFIIPAILSFIIFLFMNESPLWLITKGNTLMGIEAFKSFRGEEERVQNELKKVLESADNQTGQGFKDFVNVVCTKSFMKSILIMFFVYVAVQFSGVNTILFYAQKVFENTFGGAVDAFTLMLATDCIRMASATFMCFFMKKLPRRWTYLFCCYSICPILSGLVIYLCIKPVGYTWIAVTFMVIYIAIATLLISLSWSFVAEIFPNKVRGFGSGMSSVISYSLLFLSVKVTPDIMRNYGEAVLYGGFAAITLAASICLTFILPETNNQSLQDIENSMYKTKKPQIEKTQNMT